MYDWERAGWPNFTRDDGRLLAPLSAARLAQGRLLGAMARLGFEVKKSAEVAAAVETVLGSSEIEGDLLDRASVRSSVVKRLGVAEAVTRSDRRTDGIVRMMLDATKNHREPLTAERLFEWQAALFPDGRSGFAAVKTGAWRDPSSDPMRVVSGGAGRERVHFEAPPAKKLAGEMKRFLAWFDRREEPEGLLRAGVAHLWFVTIHPFEDGNGRLARAITDMALAQSEDEPQRFYSLSRQIQKERSDYYLALERAQKSGLDLTEWLVWFLECFRRAVEDAERVTSRILDKASFWQRNAGGAFSDRQRKVLHRLLDGFEGKLTAKKWAALAKCSIPTAQRDINELVERGVLRKNPGGSKNTSYALV